MRKVVLMMLLLISGGAYAEESTITSISLGTVSVQDGRAHVDAFQRITPQGVERRWVKLSTTDKEGVCSENADLSLADLQTMRDAFVRAMEIMAETPSKGNEPTATTTTHTILSHVGRVHVDAWKSVSPLGVELRTVTLVVTNEYGVCSVMLTLLPTDLPPLRDAFQKGMQVMATAPKDISPPSSSNKNKVILGVNVIDLPPSIASGLHRENMKAALVIGVNPGSISDKAGFKVGDVIYEFDGKPIEKFTDLQRAVSETDVGRKVSVKFLRGEKELSIDAQF
jgi:hypothetical protein